MSSVIVGIWESGTGESFGSAVAANAVFSSPVADYRGRADATHVLRLIGRVLEDVTVEEDWGAGEESLCAFEARFGDEGLQGILRERRDASGAVVAATLFLRPLRTLKGAITRMAELLADDPLPSRGP